MTATSPSDPLPAAYAGTAEWYRRRFQARNCRVGTAGRVVHAVRMEPWIGGHEVPVPACRIGTGGWDLAALEPATADVSCGRCLRLRSERAVTEDQAPGRPGQLTLDLGQVSA